MLTAFRSFWRTLSPISTTTGLLSLFLIGAVASLTLQPGTAAADSHNAVGFAVDPAKSTAPDDASSGFVPPAFPTDHIAASVAASFRAEKAQPSSYDTRALGLVSPVKNQGSCGSCYAFGSAADLESRLLAAGLPVTDLSENSIKECHYQGSSCSGGNQYMTMSYLTDFGAVLESCDPYVQSDVACTVGCGSQYTVLSWREVSGNTMPATAVVKQYLMDYGPLHTTVFAGDETTPAWAAQFSGFSDGQVLYYTGSEAPNHSVVLVGWDDDLVHAGGTGAWIVKNSWGTGWGGTCGYGTEGGYFAIAYGSASIGMYTSFVGEFMASDPDVSVQRLDEGGFTNGFGAGNATMWGMARLVMPDDAFLHRVEFWTTDATTDVDVYVYDDFSGGSPGNLLASSLNNSFAEPGYQYVEFASPVAITSGQDLYVAVKYGNLSYTYPLPVDTQGPREASSSWYSINGSTWYDLGTYNADVTIRARTSTNTVLATDDPDEGVPDLTPERPIGGLAIKRVWPNPFNPQTTIRFSLAETAPVTVTLYDLSGRSVRTLVDETRGAGTHDVIWNGRTDSGRTAPAGAYFCIVNTEKETRGTKLVLLK